MPRKGDLETKFALRHPVSLAPGGYFDELVEASEMMVNSAHGQGIDRLADGLVVEALAPDGIIEGISLDNGEAFVVGVQWHAEWRWAEHDLSRPLFEAFVTQDDRKQRAQKSICPKALEEEDPDLAKRLKAAQEDFVDLLEQRAALR